MKIAMQLFRRGGRGYALLITLVFTGIALLLLGSVITWTDSAGEQAERNILQSKSTSAAEGATEMMIAQMAGDFFNGNLQSASTYMASGLLPGTTGWPVQFSFGNPSNSATATYVSINPLTWTTNWTLLFDANYVGLHAFSANCTATSTATTSNQPYNVSAIVQQQFQLAAIPIFQYAIFYDVNLEIDPGAAMNINGPVFSNDGIWAGSSLLTFASPVSAAGVVATNAADPFSTGYNGSGGPTFQSGWTSNADTVTMPIGMTNSPLAIRSLLNLPTSGITANSSAGAMYFVNQANLIISNSAGGAISAFFQDSNNVQGLTPIPYDVAQITTIGSGGSATYATNYGYSFATNATFYDYREGKTVQAVQLDVGALTNWLSSSKGGNYNAEAQAQTGEYINSVYIYNNYPSSSSNLPAVRVTDGATLPSQGLTVVTPDPLYVLGNYNANGSSLNNGTNVANTAPAALMGDSITVLSPSWSDSYNNNTALSSRTPTATTINAAAFEGIVPTSGTNYSGGVENFLRLLENWSSSTALTYNGSIIVMFPSQYATNKWRNTGVYYNAPHRDWAFDVNFMTQSGLPPLTPKITALFRTSWNN